MIASLQDTRSLYVDFHVPEQAVQLIKIGQSVHIEVSARPGLFSLATVSAINPVVDDNTRNVLVRATLANPPPDLLPGMFAHLQVLLANPSLHIVVQESAIAFSPYGQYVYVVTARKNSAGRDELNGEGMPVLIAEQRLVETGERRNGDIVINKGLAKGEQIVTAGQIKLEHGTPVRISIDRNHPDVRPLATNRENHQ